MLGNFEKSQNNDLAIMKYGDKTVKKTGNIRNQKWQKLENIMTKMKHHHDFDLEIKK